EIGREPQQHRRVGRGHRAWAGHHSGGAVVCRRGQRLPLRNLSGNGSDAGRGIVATERARLCGGRAGHQHRAGGGAGLGVAAAGGRAALALSLRRALEEGGVTFTKRGQLLSTRSDLLPPEFTTELAKLQDRAEPAPWDQVAEVLAQSLGSPPEEVFAELQTEPAAAASIAQVHRARLRCGTGPDAEVGVK